MIEKRSHQRFNIPLNINVETYEGEASLRSATLQDISIGGAKFQSSGSFEKGTEFEISLEDQNSDFASALGLVTKNTGPLKFRMHARVLRAQYDDNDSTRKSVAVEFCSPLRIKPMEN